MVPVRIGGAQRDVANTAGVHFRIGLISLVGEPAFATGISEGTVGVGNEAVGTLAVRGTLGCGVVSGEVGADSALVLELVSIFRSVADAAVIDRLRGRVVGGVGGTCTVNKALVGSNSVDHALATSIVNGGSIPDAGAILDAARGPYVGPLDTVAALINDVDGLVDSILVPVSGAVLDAIWVATRSSPGGHPVDAEAALVKIFLAWVAVLSVAVSAARQSLAKRLIAKVVALHATADIALVLAGIVSEANPAVVLVGVSVGTRRNTNSAVVGDVDKVLLGCTPPGTGAVLDTGGGRVGVDDTLATLVGWKGREATTGSGSALGVPGASGEQLGKPVSLSASLVEAG